MSFKRILLKKLNDIQQTLVRVEKALNKKGRALNPSVITSIIFSLLLIYFAIKQINITERQNQIAENQANIAKQQLELLKKQSYSHIEPKVSCDIKISKDKKKSPTLLLINSSPITIASVSADLYDFRVMKNGKLIGPGKQDTYPGFTLYRPKMDPFAIATKALNLQSSLIGKFGIVKMIQVVEIKFYRHTDMQEFKELFMFEDTKDDMEKIDNITKYEYYEKIIELIEGYKAIKSRHPESPEKYLYW